MPYTSQNKEDPLKSWLVLDLPSIFHDVYGTLFSKSKEIVNEFGLLHSQHLGTLFPNLDLDIIHQLLISLEFCIPVDPSVLKLEVSKLTQSEEASGWLFFPALISAKLKHQPTLNNPPQQSVHYLCWQLRTSKKHSISAHVLQTILLRLAAHFVVKHYLSEGAQQHCCSIWWNGIAWQSKKGIHVTVHITNNRIIQVVSASRTSADKSCQYLTDIISDILSTVHRLSPKLAFDAYIVHPPMTALAKDVTVPPLQELFPVADIQDSIVDCEEYCLSLKGSSSLSASVAVSDLFGGYIPSSEEIDRINWRQLVLSQPQSSAKFDHSHSLADPSQLHSLAELSHDHPKLSDEPSQHQSLVASSQPHMYMLAEQIQPQLLGELSQTQFSTERSQPRSTVESSQSRSSAELTLPQSSIQQRQPHYSREPSQPESSTALDLREPQHSTELKQPKSTMDLKQPQ